MCLVTSLEAADRLGVDRDAFIAWTRQVKLKPAGYVRGRYAVWRWGDIDAADGLPAGAVVMVRYTCKRCRKIRAAPCVLDACPSCVLDSLKPGGRRLAAERCEVCNAATREGKPYCPDHIDRGAYVRWLLERLGHAYE